MYNRYWSKKVPKEISLLISKMLDEDATFPRGTAEKSASQLLKKAMSFGREDEFKNAMKVWKGLHNVPGDVIWQWFNGVFEDAKRLGRGQHKPKKGRFSRR